MLLLNFPIRSHQRLALKLYMQGGAKHRPEHLFWRSSTKVTIIFETNKKRAEKKFLRKKLPNLPIGAFSPAFMRLPDREVYSTNLPMLKAHKHWDCGQYREVKTADYRLHWKSIGVAMLKHMV